MERQTWYYIWTMGNLRMNEIVSKILDVDVDLSLRKVPSGKVRLVWECDARVRDMIRSSAAHLGIKIQVFQGRRRGTLWNWYPKKKKDLRLIKSVA